MAIETLEYYNTKARRLLEKIIPSLSFKEFSSLLPDKQKELLFITSQVLIQLDYNEEEKEDLVCV